MNLQGIAEAYSQVHEKKDSSYLETDMKKRQKNNEKARKDMEKMGTPMKNPHFEEAGADEKSMKKFQELQKNVDQKKKNIRGNDSAEQKARLEKKRGMKLDDHPQFKKESVSGIAAAYQAIYAHHEKDENGKVIEHEVEDIEEAEGMHRDAKTGEVVKKAEVGKTYYPNMPKKKTSVALRKEKEMKKEEVEVVDEGLTGARADRARQMQDSDTKSKGGKRTPADRDTAFRLGTGTAEKGTRKTGGRGGDEYGDRGRGNAAKRRMKMEELEATGKFTAEEIEAILNADLEEGKGKAAAGAVLGNVAGRVAGAALGGGLGSAAAKVGGLAGGATGAAMGAKKGKKASAALGAGVGGAVLGAPGAGIGGAIAASHEMEGNHIYEATKGDIEQYALDEIMGALGKLASSGANAVKSIGAMGGETGSKIAQGAVDTVKSGVKFAKKNPLAATAIGAGTVGAGAIAADQMGKNK